MSVNLNEAIEGRLMAEASGEFDSAKSHVSHVHGVEAWKTDSI